MEQAWQRSFKRMRKNQALSADKDYLSEEVSAWDEDANTEARQAEIAKLQTSIRQFKDPFYNPNNASISITNSGTNKNES